MSKRIIFLDCDGVICTARSHHGHEHVGGWMQDFDPMVVGMIRKVMLDGMKENIESPIEIVIVSTWRMGLPMKFDEFINSEKGQKSNIYQQLFKNNMLHLLHEDWRTVSFIRGNDEDNERPREIEEWLLAHPDVKDYVVLDDENYQKELMLPDDQYYKCDPFDGFSAQQFWKLYKKWTGKF